MQTVYYQRKGRLLVFSPTRPPVVGASETRRRSWKQNPVIVAMKLQEQLEALPEQTHGALAEHVGISRGRVCQYLSLLELPNDIIQFMVAPENQDAVMHVTERALHALRNHEADQIITFFQHVLGNSRPSR